MSSMGRWGAWAGGLGVWGLTVGGDGDGVGIGLGWGWDWDGDGMEMGDRDGMGI